MCLNISSAECCAIHRSLIFYKGKGLLGNHPKLQANKHILLNFNRSQNSLNSKSLEVLNLGCCPPFLAIDVVRNVR